MTLYTALAQPTTDEMIRLTITAQGRAGVATTNVDLDDWAHNCNRKTIVKNATARLMHAPRAAVTSVRGCPYGDLIFELAD
jgi:hypothetical protein